MQLAIFLIGGFLLGWLGRSLLLCYQCKGQLKVIFEKNEKPYIFLQLNESIKHKVGKYKIVLQVDASDSKE